MRCGLSERCWPAVALLAAVAAHASDEPGAVMLDPVVTTATRVEARGFDAPASIDALGASAIRGAQLGVNVSDVLGSVPGLVANNRQNYAQDLQISIRGFGARSTFGVRGVKLYQDGIPLTMPDGQGQTGGFALDTASRIEVLRGPLAALYGAGAGGVIQLFTEDAPARPTVDGGFAAGSDDTWRANLRAAGRWGPLDATLGGSRFMTNGYREHSRAERDLYNAKFKVRTGEQSTLTVLAGGLDQPQSRDPLGLTAAQAAADPRQAGTGALQFNTRKSVRQVQGGLAFDARVSSTTSLRASIYYGQRDVVQYLAFTGVGPTSSGGVVDLSREFAGGNLQWRWSERSVALTVGADYDWMGETRKGFVNDFGVQGALRRDERDSVASFGPYVRAEWDFAERWQLSGGVRHASVPFRVRDNFVTAQNPDDSGRLRYSATTPVAGLTYRWSDAVNVYGALGRGFETPTLAEIAYRPDGQPGLNLGLAPSRSATAEIGVKTLLGARGRFNVAVFTTDTRNDIVAATSLGGRNTFANVDRTSRDGIEAAFDQSFGAGWRATLAYTFLRARFDEGRTVGGANLAGNRLPGVPDQWLYAALAWSYAPLGFATAVDVRAASRVPANDVNSAHAAGYGVVGWRAQFAQRVGPWRLAQFALLNNIGDKRYIGSVIVNEGNLRFFEPAPGRTWLLGASLGRAF